MFRKEGGQTFRNRHSPKRRRCGGRRWTSPEAWCASNRTPRRTPRAGSSRWSRNCARCWSAGWPWRAGSSGRGGRSSPGCSTAGGGRSSRCGGPGSRRPGPPASRAWSCTTCVGRRCGTWNGRGSAARWPCGWPGTRPRRSTAVTRSWRAATCAKRRAGWRRLASRLVTISGLWSYSPRTSVV